MVIFCNKIFFQNVFKSWRSWIPTLLNALTFRNLTGLEVNGNRYANGVTISPNSLTSVSAYVQQDDLFIGTPTVKEHLIFQARVRMDKEIPYQKRMERIDEVVQELGLIDCFEHNHWNCWENQGHIWWRKEKVVVGLRGFDQPATHVL